MHVSSNEDSWSLVICITNLISQVILYCTKLYIDAKYYPFGSIVRELCSCKLYVAEGTLLFLLRDMICNETYS